MIITRAPFRISFFGGGTDYPSWFKRNGGAVLSSSIDKYCYLTCRYLPPFFEHKYRIVYSKIESCKSIDEIRHPGVREVIRFLKINGGLEVHHDGDLPARSGMGSSSSFVVAFLHAIYALKGKMVSRKQLAKESTYLEQNIMNETVGNQDQVAAAYGGLNHIVFPTKGETEVRPVTISPERASELNDNLCLFFTGVKRYSSDVAKTYVNKLEGKEKQLRLMTDMVNQGLAILNGNGPIEQFGNLLHEAWQVKRSLSRSISNPEIDKIYQTARNAGALGGKITGAGAGGFILLFVPPTKVNAVRNALKGLIYVPFKFESSGSQVLFYDPLDR